MLGSATTGKTRKTSTTSNDSISSQHAPKTFEEFLAKNKLEDWPERLTSEGPLDIDDNNLGFGNTDDICKLLRDATTVDLSAFDKVAERLEKIENVLHKYADVILERPPEPLPITDDDEQVFLTESGVANGEDPRKAKPKAKHQESISDIKKKSVDFCEYPGFLKNELNEMPGQLEAPQIMNMVTMVQDFNSGFKKFWHKIFLSEASVAVMQDLFWWYFIDKFDPGKKEDKLKLFDRIADSFVALFFSVNEEIKDKVFQVYSECLAKAVLVAFHSSFPESTKRFDERFIDDLVNICVEWTSGIKPPPESWKKWDIQKLVQSPNRRQKRKEMQAPSAAAAFYGGHSLSLDIDGFYKVVNQLGHERRRSFQSGFMNRSPHASKQSFLNDSVRASHPVGPGAKLETVSFDTLGRSTLVSHFLRQRQLQSDGKPSLIVKRTQIAKLPEKRQTYQELIDERQMKAEMLSRQYQLAVQENEEEIHKVQRDNARMNREINQLSRQILFNKNPLEIKIMSERVMDMIDQKAEPEPVTVKDEESTARSDGDNSNDGKLTIQITSHDI